MINKITKSYKKNLVLDNVEFEIKEQCTLILGQNGSGKTTLLKILGGLIKKYTGNVITGNNTSFLVDSPCLFNLKTGLENLNYFLTKDELKKTEIYLSYFDMKQYINKYVKTYSNGMKKKLAIVITLCKDSDYLLLDEPTNSLDHQTIDLLINLLILEKKEKKIIISSHDTKLLNKNLIDEILLIKNYKIYHKKYNDYDYSYYKIKTIKKIKDCTYSYIYKDDYYYFKVLNDKLENFSNCISQYCIIEMVKLNFSESIYSEGINDD